MSPSEFRVMTYPALERPRTVLGHTKPNNQGIKPLKHRKGIMKIVPKIITAFVCAMSATALSQVTSITPNHPYYIKNVTSGMVLNNGGSLTNGSPITQWNQVTSPNLQWTFIPTSGGYYQINSVK